MNLKTYLIVLIIVGGLFSITATSSYEPRETRPIKMILFSDVEDGEELNLGDLVNVTFVLKNFTNDTLNAVNVSHIIQGELRIVSAPAGTLLNESDSVNVTESFSYETPTNGSVTLSRAFVNSTYYELSFAKILPSQSMSWVITFNTSEPATYEVSPPVIKYLDKWTDQQKFDRGNRVQLRYVLPNEEDPSQKNFPVFETAETDWTLIISSMLIIAVIVVMSPLLYGKRPF